MGWFVYFRAILVFVYDKLRVGHKAWKNDCVSSCEMDEKFSLIRKLNLPSRSAPPLLLVWVCFVYTTVSLGGILVACTSVMLKLTAFLRLELQKIPINGRNFVLYYILLVIHYLRWTSNADSLQTAIRCCICWRIGSDRIHWWQWWQHFGHGGYAKRHQHFIQITINQSSKLLVLH